MLEWLSYMIPIEYYKNCNELRAGIIRIWNDPLYNRSAKTITKKILSFSSRINIIITTESRISLKLIKEQLSGSGSNDCTVYTLKRIEDRSFKLTTLGTLAKSSSKECCLIVMDLETIISRAGVELSTVIGAFG